MKPTLRSMLVAFFLSFPGVVLAQDLSETSAPESALVSSPGDALTPEKEPKRFRTWMRSTGVYERWNVRLTLRSTPPRKAR